jgi:hypothetical protein
MKKKLSKSDYLNDFRFDAQAHDRLKNECLRSKYFKLIITLY